MITNKKETIRIDTKHGIGVIDELWISELGFLMIKINYGNRWISFNMGKFNEEDNIFTNELKKQ